MSKLKAIILLIFILMTSYLLITVLQIQPKEKSPSKVSDSSHELSQKEYQNLRTEFVKILSEQNPRTAMNLLKEKTKSNQAVARSCHDLVHELGHEAYEKYGDFGQAMQYQNDICNSGYLHGIIESHFAKSENIFATMQTVCSDYSPEKFIGWECYHGVGHGLMYFTENDLPKSVSLCESYTDTASRISCINGVFMENFNVDQKLHTSKYIKATDPLYPCPEQKYEYKSDCYIYAPSYFLSLHKNEYSEALSWCKTAEKEFQGSCITGVGSQAIKENINNPSFVESICMQGSDEEKNICISGMVGLYINHFGGLDEAKELCGKLKKANQATCQQVIASRETLFQN
jgi:hypothetical protein